MALSVAGSKTRSSHFKEVVIRSASDALSAAGSREAFDRNDRWFCCLVFFIAALSDSAEELHRAESDPSAMLNLAVIPTRVSGKFPEELFGPVCGRFSHLDLGRCKGGGLLS